MDDFVGSLGDTMESGKLRDALNRVKPFRQFKDTLHERTGLSDAWYVFEQKELARMAEEWDQGGAGAVADDLRVQQLAKKLERIAESVENSQSEL